MGIQIGQCFNTLNERVPWIDCGEIAMRRECAMTPCPKPESGPKAPPESGPKAPPESPPESPPETPPKTPPKTPPEQPPEQTAPALIPNKDPVPALPKEQWCLLNENNDQLLRIDNDALETFPETETLYAVDCVTKERKNPLTAQQKAQRQALKYPFVVSGVVRNVGYTWKEEISDSNVLLDDFTLDKVLDHYYWGYHNEELKTKEGYGWGNVAFNVFNPPSDWIEETIGYENLKYSIHTIKRDNVLTVINVPDGESITLKVVDILKSKDPKFQEIDHYGIWKVNTGLDTVVRRHQHIVCCEKKYQKEFYLEFRSEFDNLGKGPFPNRNYKNNRPMYALNEKNKRQRLNHGLYVCMNLNDQNHVKIAFEYHSEKWADGRRLERHQTLSDLVLEYNETRRLGYSAVVGDWTPCSAECGPGKQHRDVQCANGQKILVHNRLCDTLPISVQDCNKRSCPTYEAVAGTWGPCSETCGDKGQQTRVVNCEQTDHEDNVTPVSIDKCPHPPSTQRPCNRTPCPPVQPPCNDTYDLIEPQRAHALLRFPMVINNIWYTAEPDRENGKVVGTDPRSHAIVLTTKVPHKDSREARPLFVNGGDDPLISISPTQVILVLDRNDVYHLPHGAVAGATISMVIFIGRPDNPVVQAYTKINERENGKQEFVGISQSVLGDRPKGSWVSGLRPTGSQRYRAIDCHKWYQSKEWLNDVTMEAVLEYWRNA